MKSKHKLSIRCVKGSAVPKNYGTTLKVKQAPSVLPIRARHAVLGVVTGYIVEMLHTQAKKLVTPSELIEDNSATVNKTKEITIGRIF